MNREQIHTLKQTMYIEVEDTDWSALMQVNDYVLIKLLLEIYSDAETSHQAKVLADCLEEIGFDKPATDNLYVRFLYRQTCGEPTYTDDNGQPLTREQVAPFLPAKRNNYSNQGTTDPVVILTYALESIQEITMHGETYTVQAEAAAAVA